MMEWRFNNSKLVINQSNTVKYYMFCITKWTLQTRSDTVAEKHKQNINLLFCNNFRADKSTGCIEYKQQELDKFQSTNNNTTNLRIHEVKILSIKWLSWLLLFKRTEIQESYFLLSYIVCFLTVKKKKKWPRCYANLKGTLNCYEHLRYVYITPF